MPAARRDLGLHSLLDLIERALQGRLEWSESLHVEEITKKRVLRLEARSHDLTIVYEYAADDFHYLGSRVVDARGRDVEEMLRRAVDRWYSALDPAPGRKEIAIEAVGDVRQAIAALRYAVRRAVSAALPTDATARAAIERLAQNE
jgi:hypothetical protein